MMNVFLHRLSLFAVLFGAWYVLSGKNDPLFIAFGIVSSLAALFIVIRMDVADSEAHPFHLAFSAPFYWLWLLKEMVKSGFAVTKLVWSPHMKISPCFHWVPLSQSSDLGRAVYANSVTLTPGTVCVDVDQHCMFLHALEESSIEELRDGEMDNRVTRLTETSYW